MALAKWPDKRRAVLTLMEDAEWSKWSDNKIAEKCGVSQPFVGKLRESLITVISENPPTRTYTTKHGTEATMDTSRIGRLLLYQDAFHIGRRCHVGRQSGPT